MLCLNVVANRAVYFRLAENVESSKKVRDSKDHEKICRSQVHHSTSKDFSDIHKGYGIFCAMSRAKTQESRECFEDSKVRSSTS